MNLFLIIAAFCGSHAHPVNIDREIAAIAQIEDGQWGQPGGTCCIRYAAWSDHSNLPYYLSAREDKAVPVYREHLAWIEKHLPKNSVPVTPASVYVVWRYGLSAGCRMMRAGLMPECGVRCDNIYASLVERDCTWQAPN